MGKKTTYFELRQIVKSRAENLINSNRTDKLGELFEAVRVGEFSNFGNNKARMGDVYQALKEITEHLVQNLQAKELKGLFQACVDFDFYERWRPFVLCCLVRGLYQLDPDYSQGAWNRSLDIFKQLAGKYDFWEGIPEILQLADDCNWLDGTVASLFHQILQSAVTRTSYGWEDSHLVILLAG